MKVVQPFAKVPDQVVGEQRVAFQRLHERVVFIPQDPPEDLGGDIAEPRIVPALMRGGEEYETIRRLVDDGIPRASLCLDDSLDGTSTK